MSDNATAKTAAPVTIDHSMRKLEALEWRAETSGAPLVVATTELSADLVGPFAEQIMGKHRVIAINPGTHWDPITTCWWAGEPIVLLAQGEAGKLACQAALAAPGAIRALALVDYAPDDDSTDHKALIVPTLVFRGRDSDATTHAQAVKLHEETRGSHLIEPEHCGSEPTRTAAVALAESVTWFISELGKPHMEFETNGEPVDPRG